jgi:RNA-directed DNA polymerase
MALDGMEKALSDRFHANRLGRVDLRFKNARKANLVRYADDFIITAATEEIAMQAKKVIRDFLSARGLELSEEKTVISHINDGFDLLGWTFRKFKGKLIIKPSKSAIKALAVKLSEIILRRGKAWKQEVLIEKLNQAIRGWANYHQSVCASDAFSHIDYILFEFLWQWAKRRHPKKGKWWIPTKYWRRKGSRSWVFSTDDKELLRAGHIPIVRHTRVRMDANPYLETEYFIQRQFNHGMKRLSGRFKQVWKNQNGCCHHCGLPMDTSDEREIFFKVPKSVGGKDEVRNMAYVHSYCQFLYTERRSKE